MAIAASGILMPASEAQQSAPKETEEQKTLKRYANESLYQLKYSIKNDGFFSNRVALNIWESNARDAGVFDELLYKQFKEQIYKKSINENLGWFEFFVSQKNFKDAETCLQLWKLHCEEMEVFNQEQYDELRKKMK
ncbi:MAG: hypothetical protein C4530_09240 [Desulfobacteraceae bacterium]|nr:MAG: hypothetical protein C4530_09240 [Desulfobacteraceae bacterium]